MNEFVGEHNVITLNKTLVTIENTLLTAIYAFSLDNVCIF